MNCSETRLSCSYCPLPPRQAETDISVNLHLLFSYWPESILITFAKTNKEKGKQNKQMIEADDNHCRLTTTTIIVRALQLGSLKEFSFPSIRFHFYFCNHGETRYLSFYVVGNLRICFSLARNTTLSLSFFLYISEKGVFQITEDMNFKLFIPKIALLFNFFYLYFDVAVYSTDSREQIICFRFIF